MDSGSLHRQASTNSPPPSPVPYVFFVVPATGSGEDAEASTIDTWSASFSNTASGLNAAVSHKKHRSALVPRGRRDELRIAQVS